MRKNERVSVDAGAKCRYKCKSQNLQCVGEAELLYNKLNHKLETPKSDNVIVFEWPGVGGGEKM